MSDLGFGVLAMIELDGTASPHELGPGVTLTAPGVLGTAELQAPADVALGRADVSPRLGDNFSRTILNAGLRPTHAILLTPNPASVASPPAEEDSTPGQNADNAVLEVPARGANEAAVLMVSDHSGVISWHAGDRSGAPVGAVPGGSDGATTTRFVVPPRRLALSPDAEADRPVERLAVGSLGHKLLSVLTYPVPPAESVVGSIADELARIWERSARPYGVRLFTLPEARTAGAGALSDAGWRMMGQGRALLFLHGTFVTSAFTFAGLADEVLDSLSATYGGRLFAFEHPTMSEDPVANVEEFLGRIPKGVKLDVDIVCHSRGGLLARILSGELPTVPIEGVEVGKIVFVGTPNVGTPLADGANLGTLVDLYTTMLNRLAPGPWLDIAGILDGVLELVKIVGVGALDGLPGIQAMTPGSALLTALNTGPLVTAKHYAVAADFTPSGALVELLAAADAPINCILGGAANDIVVPTAGVGTVPGDLGFPVPRDRQLTLGGR